MRGSEERGGAPEEKKALIGHQTIGQSIGHQTSQFKSHPTISYLLLKQTCSTFDVPHFYKYSFGAFVSSKNCLCRDIISIFGENAQTSYLMPWSCLSVYFPGTVSEEKGGCTWKLHGLPSLLSNALVLPVYAPKLLPAAYSSML